MRRTLPDVLPWVLVVAASTAALYLVRAQPGLDETLQWFSPVGHLQVVTAVSAICAILAGTVAVVVLPSPNPRLLWLALAFLTMAGFYAVHGLTTPGIILAREHAAIIGFSGRLAFLCSTAFLAASAIDWKDRVPEAVASNRKIVLALTIAGLVAYAGVALRWPEIVPRWFAGGSTGAMTAQYANTLAVVALGGFAAARYFVGYRRSGVPLYGAVTVAALLVIEAQISMQLATTWRATFWLYHIQLLTGCLVLLSAVLAEHRRGRAAHAIAQLTISDVMGQLRAGQADSFLGLTAALEARDGYTLGHGERVGALAIMIGQQLHLPIPRLRALATGAVLHDIGKIGVPDAVLHKHGSLTSEEYEIIREHPTRGDNMLAASLGGPIERSVVRSHHERWDGTGYPDRLAGEAIPLEARITAVADVYDALRSNRAYRPALTRAQAVAMIADGAGTQFDPVCADALLSVVDAWEGQYAAEHLTYEERRAA